MPNFGNSFSGLANDRKLTEQELIRAIRFAVSAEYEAIQVPTNRIRIKGAAIRPLFIFL